MTGAPTIQETAEALVAEMIANFGARFEVHDATGDRPASWTYEPEPELRQAARRHLQAINRTAPGFNSAMVAAIRKRGGAAS